MKYGKEKSKVIYNESKLIRLGKKNYSMNFSPNSQLRLIKVKKKYASLDE